MRRALVALLTLVVLLAMASALWSYLRWEPDAPGLVLAEISGDVRISRSAADLDAKPGIELLPNDRVGTGPDGRARLSVGDQTEIRLGPSAQVAVQAVNESGVSLELEGGALQATVRPDSGGVKLSNRGRQVLATIADFEMGVSNDILQVSVSRGELSASGIDRSRIAEGEIATIVDRHAEVGPVPEELLLAIDWPQEARTRAQITRVSGRTQPGANVTLSGSFGRRTISADTQGHFSAELPLAEGDNPIEVRAVDVFGREASVEGMLQTRDTRGPSFQGGVEYRER